MLFTIQTGSILWRKYSDTDQEMLVGVLVTIVAYLIGVEPEEAVEVISTCGKLLPPGIEVGGDISDEALAALEGDDAVRAKLVRVAGQIAVRIGPIIQNPGAELPVPLKSEIVAVEELLDFQVD